MAEIEGNGSTDWKHSFMRIALHIEAVLEEIQTGGYSQITLKESLVSSQVEDGVGGKIMRLDTVVFTGFHEKVGRRKA